MRDIQLNALRETFARINMPTLVESHVPLRENKVYLPEAKKRFPHLAESFLLENKVLMENINFFKVTVKEIQNSFQGLKFAEARAVQKAMMQFAIMEHHARNTPDDAEMAVKIEESSKLILELQDETTFDPEQTLGGMDFDSGEAAPEPEKKPGLMGRIGGAIKGAAAKVIPKKIREFLAKAGELIKNIIQSKEFWKAVAIGAAMVMLGFIAAAFGGWIAVGFAAFKTILAGISVFKGAQGLVKTADFAQGKKGVEGVKQWIQSAKQPANAAKVIISLAQIAMGLWGIKTAVGQACDEVKKMAEAAGRAAGEATAGAPGPKPDAPAPKPTAPAPAEAPKPTEAPAPAEAPVAPAPDLSRYSAWGASKAEELQSAIQQAATGGGGSMKEILNPLAEKIAKGVASGAITREQGIAALEGLAKGIVNNNGGLPYKGILGMLLKVANLN